MKGHSAQQPKQGFTLLEVMAVLLLLALLAGIALPALVRNQATDARNDAREIAAALEYARRAALTTRSPHRLVIDFQKARWWLEHRANPLLDLSPSEAGEAKNWGTLNDLPLFAASQESAEHYRPLPGVIGQGNVLRDDVKFGGAKMAGGWIDEGQLFIELRPDGHADPTQLLLFTNDGSRIWLDIDAWNENVGLRDETG